MAERLERDERQPVFMPSKESTPKSDALASRPTEIELSEVSKEVSSQYRKLLTHLGTPLSKVESLLQNKLGNVEETCFKGLVHWLGRNGEEPYFPATWTILLEAIDKGAERKDYAERLRQKLLGGGKVTPEPFGTARLIPIRHPLESKFIRLFEAVQQLLETSKTPPLDDLKEFCKYLFCWDASTVEAACCVTNYREVVKILYSHSYWMGYNYIEMLISHYKEPLITIQALVDSYNAELASIVTTRLSEINKISKPLPDQPQSKGKNLQKIVFRYNLDADGITLESLVLNVNFLSSRLHIPLELINVLLGSVALVLSLPTERAVQLWSRIEECWRELWKMRVVWIHLDNRSMNLVQKANAEKIKYVPWKKELVDTIGLTLYKKYGSQPALKSAVEEYKSAGVPLAEQRASLEWLFHHHVPTESRSLLQDPFAVLGRTLFALRDCADVEKVIALLEQHYYLKDPGLSVLKLWQNEYRLWHRGLEYYSGRDVNTLLQQMIDGRTLEEVNQILDSTILFKSRSPLNECEHEDVFVTYFQLFANQHGGEKAAEHAMNSLRPSVPSEYQRDLKEAFQSVVMKRGEGMALSTGHQSVPGTSTQGQQSAYSSVLGTAEDLAKVKQKYQLFQVSHVIPWLSSVGYADDKLKQVLLTLTVHSDDPASLLFKEADVKGVMDNILQYSAWYELDVLQQVQMECLASKADELRTFEQDRRSLLAHISVDKAFPSPLLSFPPLLGYSPMVVHLALSPTWVTMWQVWELKNIICSALHLQPYSLLLRGYSAGSTNLVFYLASSARVTTERVGVAMMSSDVIIHSMVFGCGTQHEVKYHLDQFLSESAPQPSPHVQPSC